MNQLFRNPKIKLYILSTFLLGLIFYIAIPLSGGMHGSDLLTTLLMWVPAMSAFLVRLKYKKSTPCFGFRPHKPGYLLVSYLLPILVSLIVYGLTWCLNLSTYQPMSTPMLIGTLTVGIIICSISTLGEEIGWRGFLLHECMKEYSFLHTSIIMGVIWYCYHLPLILFSDYNNGNVLFSAVCFLIQIIPFTILANYLVLKGQCIWAAVLLHSSDNICLSVFGKMTVNKAVTPYIVTEFGIGFAITYTLFALCLLLYLSKRKGSRI